MKHKIMIFYSDKSDIISILY